MISDAYGRDSKLYSDTILKLAWDCEKKGHFREAAEFYFSFIKLYPREPLVAHYNLARINYKYLNQPKNALRILEQLIALLESSKNEYILKNISVDLAPIYHLKARIHLRLKQNNKAIICENLAMSFLGKKNSELELSINLIKTLALSRREVQKL